MSSPGTPASKFLATGAMPWRPFGEAPGVSFRVLKTHPPGNGATLMLHFEPGTGAEHNRERVAGLPQGLSYLITHCARGGPELESITED